MRQRSIFLGDGPILMGLAIGTRAFTPWAGQMASPPPHPAAAVDPTAWGDIRDISL
jgi:hypothetical protein